MGRLLLYLSPSLNDLYRIMKVVVFIAALFCAGLVGAQSKPEIAFTIPERDLIPEGITYDPIGKNFYLGSIHKKKILKITSRGQVSEFASAPRVDLHEVLGMKVDADKRKLWVCSNTPEHDSTNFISSIHVFDLTTNTLIKKYQINGKQRHLFNDLVIASNGDVYITDSELGSVHVIKKDSDTIEEFLKPKAVAYPNGIALTPDEKKLMVSTGSGLGIVSIDLQSKAITPIRHAKYLLIGIDGMYRKGNSLIVVQNNTFPESVLRMDCSADFTKIEKVSFVAVNHPAIDLPTTGVIVDNYIYFIANSQLLQIVGNKGVIKDPSTLKDVVIMRAKID